MSQQEFRALQQRLIGLYGESRYDEGLRLLEAEMGRYPDQAQHTHYWQACLLARAGRAEESLTVLRQTLEQGIWIPSSVMQEDLDLDPVRTLPGFTDLLASSRQLQEALRAKAVPQRITLLPEGAAPPFPMLVALHGNSSSSAATADYWRPALAEGWLLALPQSSQAFGSDSFIWNELDWAVQEVQQHYVELMSTHPVDPERTVVGGFSMGGGVAVRLALSQAIPVSGFVVVGPWLGDVAAMRPFLDTARDRGVRGAVIVGEQDKQCLKVSRDLTALMQEHGLACRLEVISDLGHTYPDAFDGLLRQALAYVSERS